MDLECYVNQVREQLIDAARVGDERTREMAVALAATAGPAVRLALLGAVSAAAEEITAQLADARVNAQLDGDSIQLEVTRAQAAPVLLVEDGDASARVSLRLSESLKSQVEVAARREVISVNTWLIRAAGAALGRQRPADNATGNHHHHITGWING